MGPGYRSRAPGGTNTRRHVGFCVLTRPQEKKLKIFTVDGRSKRQWSEDESCLDADFDETLRWLSRQKASGQLWTRTSTWLCLVEKWRNSEVRCRHGATVCSLVSEQLLSPQPPHSNTDLFLINSYHYRVFYLHRDLKHLLVTQACCKTIQWMNPELINTLKNTFTRLKVKLQTWKKPSVLWRDSNTLRLSPLLFLWLLNLLIGCDAAQLQRCWGGWRQ